MADVLGSEYNCAYAPIKDSSGQTLGMLFVGLPAAGMDIQQRFIMSVVVSTLIIMTILGVGSWLVIGKQMRKLVDVSDAMEKVAAGNLQIADLTITAEDEIGSLSKALNEMKKQLRNLVTKVAASAEELTASGAQAAESITHVAQNTVDMTEGASKQADTVNELRTKILDMTDKIHALQESAVEMNRAAAAGRRRLLTANKKQTSRLSRLKMFPRRSASRHRSSAIWASVRTRSARLSKPFPTFPIKRICLP